jgi:hypothetical protein
MHLECPYGQPGERLWVRESWLEEQGKPYYRADYTDGMVDACETLTGGYPDACRSHPGCDGCYPQPYKPHWKPSIYMPRWASRICLEITGVRVQRLQDISEDDVRAEGIKGCTKDGSLIKYGLPDYDGLPGGCDIGWPWQDWRTCPKDAYRDLWDKINGKDSWKQNPWVWVVEFKRVNCE